LPILGQDFSAMQFRLGSWEAYQINIDTSNLISTIRLSDDVFGDTTIDNAMQRKPDLKRARTGIGNYINRNEHRFFNSLVIAVVGGKPSFEPIEIDPNSKYAGRIPKGTFGVINFDGHQKYYALDGQHRLVGIREVLDPESPINSQKPRGFEDEIIPVILVVQPEDVDEEEFRRRYRRLFGNLNRNQKPTSTVTNIIMDEDNLFNILTRRLIVEHPFFRSEGSDIKIKTNEGGKNILSTENFFTSIETLNDINTILLTSKNRSSSDGAYVKLPDTDKLAEITTVNDVGDTKNYAWKLGPSGKPSGDFAKFTLTYRPEDIILESLFFELTTYWDAIVETLTFLDNEPMSMRELITDPYNGKYIPSVSNKEETQQNAVFRPIFQTVLAQIIRNLLDDNFNDDASYTKTKIKNAIKPIKLIDWSLFSPPFRGLLFHQKIDDESSWIMRSEDRPKAQAIVVDILDWMMNDIALDKATIDSYKNRYKTFHLPRPLSDSEVDEYWEVLSAQRRKILSE